MRHAEPLGGHSSLRPRLACWPAWDWRNTARFQACRWLAHPGSCRWCWPCWAVWCVYMALQIHKYTTKDPVKRAQLKPLDPQKAFGTLVACKALGLRARRGRLVRWQIIMSLPHGEAEFYSQAIIECVVACVVCVADMIVGSWGVAVPHPAYRRAGKSGREKGRTAQSLCGRRHEGVYKIGYESCHEIESLNVRPSLTPSQSFFGTRNIASCAMQATSSPSCV